MKWLDNASSCYVKLDQAILLNQNRTIMACKGTRFKHPQRRVQA